MSERSREAAAMVRAALGVAVGLSTAAMADWPTYRHDAGRSGFTRQPLRAALHRQWTYVSRCAPRPAWPEPVREVHLMAFDRAYQVVAAGGIVYFGSSADHKVYAIDLATGRERWSFSTDAPVRFAPTVWGRKLYVASDDGRAYCLSAGEGTLLWRFRGGPGDERMLGNENMISRWPLRSGLLVEGGTVYLTAGMWPSEGVWVYALKAEDGSVVWKTQGPAGFAPQGYLAANAERLVAPAGRAKAWVIERRSGKARALGGTSQAVVKGNLLLSGPFPHKADENLPIAGGVPFAARSRRIAGWDLRTGKRRGNFAGAEHVVVSDEAVYLAGEGKIAAHALAGMRKRWELEHPEVFSLAAAGTALVVGGRGRVALLEASTGRTLWSAEVRGEARGLAVADGRLLVSTHEGRIVCFGPAKPSTAGAAAAASGASPTSMPDRAALAGRILEDTGMAAGFCLLAGVGDGRLALELARQSQLRIYCAEPDAAKVAAARRLLDAAGLYGTRVTVHHVASAALPYPDYFANLIVLADPSAAAAPYSPAELYRVLRPCGGTAYVITAAAGKPPGGQPSSIAGGELTRTRLSAGALKLVRGPLPGAGEWTHQYADAGSSACSGDERVRWPLKLLWFGKPGPGRMMNRHWRGPAPMCVDGRMFLLGQHSVIALDAYNGRELWSRRIPSVARRVVDIRGGSLAADADSLYLATADVCLRLDAETGRLRRVYRLPIARPRFDLSAPVTFALGEPGRAQIRNTAEALELTLTTAGSALPDADRLYDLARGDSWELFFDFRPEARRTGLYGPGAFHAIVVPPTQAQPSPSWRSGVWSSAPDLEITGTLDDDRTETIVRIRWADIRKLVGAEVGDFHFGLILNSSGDPTTPIRRTRRYANDASYRLANCWARLVINDAGAGREPPVQAKLPAPAPAESLTWGNLFVSGETVVGTVVATRDSPAVLKWGRDFSSEGHDYTGPPVGKVLGAIGVEGEARQVFALGRNDGRLRWSHTPAGAVPHNGIVVARDRVYLLDKPRASATERLKRRGQPATQTRGSSLQVLDLATGRRLWRIQEGLDRHVALRLGGGVLLAAYLKGMTAYDAESGKKLWSIGTAQPMHHCSAFVRAPVIAGDWVYDEPHAYALRTGRPRMDPAGKPWKWGGIGGCGTVSAVRNMLFFRARTPAFLDAAGGTGRHGLPAIRPGCYINMIAAGGLALIPEASSGCGCPFNFQTTVAMMPAERTVVAASDNSGGARDAVDDDPLTCWRTAAPMGGGEWFRVVLARQQQISGIVLDTRGSPEGYPRGYEVHVANATFDDGQLAAEGIGDGPVTTISFPKPVVGRIITIVQTGSAEAGRHSWSIHDLRVLSCPARH